MNKSPIDKIKIILVEDHTLTRFGLKTAFEEAPTIQVIGEAETGEEGISMVSQLNPDVVLMDLGLPGMNGIDATQKIKSLNEDIKIVILTSHNNEEEVWAALGAGANAYCLKDIEPDRLIHVVESIHEGAAWLDPSIANIVLKSISNQSSKKVGSTVSIESHIEKSLLTERELEVLKLLVDGNSNAEIAKKLVVSIHTAKAHVCSILQKLSVDDRTQAAIKALKDGIV
ncbi:MAG: response regulator transcription factor [Cyanobacteriota bacterium]